MKWRAASVALLVAVTAVIGWVRLQPARVERLDAQSRRWFTVADAGGREHVLLGDYDSYAWLRIARNWIRTGSPCDAIVDGECRDQRTLAPVGARDPYAKTLHPAAIAALHRIAVVFDPALPLASSAFLVPVLVGVLGVPPAFLIARRLGGLAAGFIASLAIGLLPAALARTFGSDNDIWNLTLPLWLVWAAAHALDARERRPQVLWALAASGFAALQASAWSGWVFAYAVVVFGMAADLVISILTRIAGLRVPERGAARPALVLLVFWASTGLLVELVPAEVSYLRIPLGALSSLRESPQPDAIDPATADAWPVALEGVNELVRPTFRSLVDTFGGRWMCGLACLGLLLLMLPPPRRLRSVPSRGAALLTLVWFFAALVLAFRARRFGLLLTAPFGLAVGVGVGRLVAWSGEGLVRFRLPIRAAAGAIALAGIAALAVVLVQRGWNAAIAYRPSVHRSWVEALERLRVESPPEAIVFSWWDHGHWIKYFADRRVAADGGTLTAHVHTWIARALAAGDERQTVGILRMLACASEATPYPEGAHGAYGKLRAAGLNDERARAAIEHLVSVDRAAAEDWLRSSGLEGTVTAAVLASTHCTAPPAYLVLDRRISEKEAWRRAARWRGEAPLDGFLGSARCDLTPGADSTTCRLRTRFAANAFVENLVVRGGDWGSARLTVRVDGKNVRSYGPAEVLIATPDGIEGLTPAAAGLPISVLIDEQRQRVIAGPSDLLRSTLTGLVFLEDRYNRYFEPFSQKRGGPLIWAVRWPD